MMTAIHSIESSGPAGQEVIDVPENPVAKDVADNAVPDIPVLELARPMPGFDGDQRFALVRLDDDGTLCELRSLDHEDLRFLVITPGQFFADYEPVIDDEDANLLGLTSAEEALVLLVLTPGDSLASTTANLVAPVVVNTTNLRAAQVILDEDRHPIAAPLVA
ncbi:flagellar assembly protein FliW [Nocardioides sp. AE5]|uniref:flagellar assembly protein FliW n=1 Tax=Nocardioides sp. AE5 TaxID=2962573 RepID=UPI002881C3B4|nr:flagellar assembly protein FliW [Nocardioides sp. AE5]MDT0200821.1 flagellar assembly protein FliW [Nocardioides sp. AE5]